MDPKELFLDVNVIMYAAGKRSPYKNSCIKILEAVRDKKMKVVIDAEIVQELLYRYHHLGFQGRGVELAWYTLSLKPKLLPVTRGDIEHSLHLYQNYLEFKISPRDTLHAVVMLNNGISGIISADKHYDTIKEVQREDPIDFVSKL